MKWVRWLTAACVAAAVGTALCMLPGADRAAANPAAVCTAPALYLEWAPDLDAACYEVELFDAVPSDLPADARSGAAIYRNGEIYTNSALISRARIDRDGQVQGDLWWRVRPLDLDRHPLGSFSELRPYPADRQADAGCGPRPRSHFDGEPGSVLLYPVYSFTPVDNAAQYEVEVTDAAPENPDGWAPSAHRIFSKVISNANLYDPSPRIGSYWWRVRAMDADGRPLGGWSEAEPFRTAPEDGWQVAIAGDSISHGGGRLSYGPADWTYSYAHYLDFPAVNLSESGDTSRATAERFDRDIAPFHPEYLLIMTGTNSLRAGVPAESVIADLQEIQEKCRRLGIRPVLLTLPPIHPDNIRRAFDQPTANNWQAAFAEVNAFIRTQTHIDTAAPFDAWTEMPSELAADGLHGDWRAKQMMAEVINRELPRIAPDLRMSENGLHPAQ